MARDRARRFVRTIREALQERRLHYRGADVGMATLSNESDEALAAVVRDARQTVDDVARQRIRDRERGYMEMPLVVALEGIVERVERARRLDRAASLGGLDMRAARAAVLALLEDALLRLEVYCGAYDEKRPVGPRRQADVAHLLEQVERDAFWSRTQAGRHAEPSRAFDRAPPPILSDPPVLEDLLRAARAAVGEISEGWRVEPGGAGRPLELALGTAGRDAGAVPAPERLARAGELLASLHPVAVTCLGRTPAASGGLLSAGRETAAPRVEAVRLALSDEAAGSLELVVGAAGGEQARLDPEAERAVRALLQSPPLPQEGPPPPERTVALLGLLQALDAGLAKRLLSRLTTNACRVAASRLPRESTRKAPLRRALAEALAAAFPEFPAHRLEPVSRDLAEGRLGTRHANPADVAVALALIGRDAPLGGEALRRAIDLESLTGEDVAALVRDLCQVAAVRRDLERGAAVDAARITRLEQSAIAVLGRLGRLS